MQACKRIKNFPDDDGNQHGFAGQAFCFSEVDYDVAGWRSPDLYRLRSGVGTAVGGNQEDGIVTRAAVSMGGAGKRRSSAIAEVPLIGIGIGALVAECNEVVVHLNGKSSGGGFLHLNGFMSMNLDRHFGAHLQLFDHLIQGDGDSAAKTFDVPITDDPDIEGDEPLNLSLSGPTGGAILGTQSTAVLSIVDNDIPPAGALQFSSPTYLVVEGVPSALITVTRTGGTSGPVSVMYATADGTAVNPDDYLNSFGVLNWPHGDGSNKTFIVPIVSDSYKELPETINLSLGGPTGGAVLGGIPTAILTIQDQPYPVPVFAPWTLLMLSGLLGLFGLRRTWSRRA